MVTLEYADKNFNKIWVPHKKITHSVSYKYIMLAYERNNFIPRDTIFGGLCSDNPFTHFSVISVDGDRVFTMISCAMPVTLSSIIVGPISLNGDKANEDLVLHFLNSKGIIRKDVRITENIPEKFNRKWHDNCAITPELWQEKKKGFKHRMMNRMRRVEKILDIEVRPFDVEKDLPMVDTFTSEWLSWDNHEYSRAYDNDEKEEAYTRYCIQTMHKPQIMIFRYKPTGVIIGFEIWSTPLQGITTVNLGKSYYGDALAKLVDNEDDLKLLDWSLARFAYYYLIDRLFSNDGYKLLIYAGFIYRGVEQKFGTLKERFCNRFFVKMEEI